VLWAFATWALLAATALSSPAWANDAHVGTAPQDRPQPIVFSVDGTVEMTPPWLQQLGAVTRTMVARSRTCLLHVTGHNIHPRVSIASHWLPVCQQAPWNALSLHWGRYHTGYAPMQQERAFDQPDSGYRLWLRWHWNDARSKPTGLR